MEKMREEFEAWCESECMFTPNRSPEHDGYSAIGTNDMWLAWQASRAALCVELPRTYTHHECDYKRDVIDTLDCAGITHK